MQKLFGLVIASLVLTTIACRGDDASDKAGDLPATAAPGSATVAPSQGPTQSSSASPGAQALSPSIEDALSCRVPAVVNNPGTANLELQRYSLSKFPRASCNDGSPAVLYFRPFEGEANRNKWVIVLNGGGGCDTGQDCANRWCGVDTNFNAENMSTRNAGPSLAAGGILDRRADNPLGNYNQVEVRYCTSDLWAGRGLGVAVSAKDPKSGKDVTFEANFAGAYVFEALLAALRGESDKLVYQRSNTAMPDLDAATEVVFAGGSAGGAGVITNLDRFAQALRSNANPPVVRGFIEAIVGPDHSKLGFGSTNGCAEKQLCSYEAAMKATAARETDAAGQNSWTDDSCIEWHRKNAPGTEWQCYDLNHLLANHVTTPYFVRTSLADQLLVTGAIEAGLTSADGKPLNVLTYGQATATFLRGLQAAVKGGHEHDATDKLPGVFAPSCRTHYTLLQSELVYGVTVESPPGTPHSFFDVWNNWVSGKSPDVVVSNVPRTDKCTGE